MVAPTFGDFQDFILRLEDQAAPGTYVKICGLTSRGITKTNNINEQAVPADCDDESLTDLISTVETRQATMEASGLYTQQAKAALESWFNDSSANNPQNIQVEYPFPASGETQFEQGPALLETWTVTAEKGNKVEAELSIRFTTFPVAIPAP